MNTVNKPFRKKDAMQLVTGQPVYMDDLVPADCLIVKLLRSPHANAIVKSINTAVAKKVPGIEAIFTWEDVPQDARRYTQAGQTYPEASPYDRLLIDRHVRFVGDVVAIVAGKDDKCVDKALKMIKVEYEVLEPVLDYHTAKDNPILVHPEDNWESLCPVGGDNKRNLCAHDECGSGDIDAVLADCDVVIDHVYHTKACQQAMMETFRTYCSIDLYGRLNVLSSTQIVFHARRIIANALHIPKSMVRVTKPRIGGGFGAKQTAVCEVYPAFVTWKTRKPSKLIFTREESHPAIPRFQELPLDYRIGSVHMLYSPQGKVVDIDTPADIFRQLIDAHFEGDLDYVVHLYYKNLLRMLELGGFDIVGHADKMHYNASCYRPGLLDEAWYDTLVRDYFAAIAERGYIVEINTKSYHELGTFYPNERYFPFLKELGIRVQVNSDAHYPERINNSRAEALAALKKVGFDTVVEWHGGKWEDKEIL